MNLDARYDLVLERTVDAPREVVWAAWTQPEHLKRWFTPAPWKTVECEVELRPGGKFLFVMESPEGKRFPHETCYLEVVEGEKLVWTTALKPGFRPSPKDTAMYDLCFTAIITLESVGNGTRYRATVLHASEESRMKHEKLGFHDGWGAAWEQLVALFRSGQI